MIEESKMMAMVIVDGEYDVLDLVLEKVCGRIRYELTGPLFWNLIYDSVEEGIRREIIKYCSTYKYD